MKIKTSIEYLGKTYYGEQVVDDSAMAVFIDSYKTNINVPYTASITAAIEMIPELAVNPSDYGEDVTLEDYYEWRWNLLGARGWIDENY
jgi:hypothetical protein